MDKSSFNQLHKLKSSFKILIMKKFILKYKINKDLKVY